MSVVAGADGQVTAAWIGGILLLVVSFANIAFTFYTRNKDQKRRAAERAEDIVSRRREMSDEQRRTTYMEFVQAVEELVDRVQRLIPLDAIASYKKGLGVIEETRRQAEQQGALGLPELSIPDNPLPEIAGTDEEKTLTKLAIRARTARVMVEIVGPESVGDTAIAYERALNGVVSALIGRDLDAEAFFVALPDPRDAFVDAASLALDPDAKGAAV
jgi:hypothetical protein